MEYDFTLRIDDGDKEMHKRHPPKKMANREVLQRDLYVLNRFLFGGGVFLLDVFFFFSAGKNLGRHPCGFPECTQWKGVDA